jgi:hypothetical protein
MTHIDLFAVAWGIGLLTIFAIAMGAALINYRRKWVEEAIFIAAIFIATTFGWFAKLFRKRK